VNPSGVAGQGTPKLAAWEHLTQNLDRHVAVVNPSVGKDGSAQRLSYDMTLNMMFPVGTAIKHHA
jgi:hypothetical protein